MKTINKPIKGKQLQNHRGHNITLIDHTGCYCSTQVWNGGEKEAARWILDHVKDGLDEDNNWNKPYVRAFVNPIGTTEVHEFDLLELSDLVLLGQAAGVTATCNGVQTTGK